MGKEEEEWKEEKFFVFFDIFEVRIFWKFFDVTVVKIIKNL